MTKTAVWINPKPISKITLIAGIIGIANHPAKPLINIAITVPLTILPNKRRHKEMGNEISLKIFIGNITGFGSKKLFK